MSHISEKSDAPNNKHLLIGSMILGTGLFDVIEIIFYFTFIVLDKYKFNIYTFLINIMLTSILGGVYIWTRKSKRNNQIISIVFFITGIVFIASKFVIEILTGINMGVITPFNGTIMALGTLGYLIVIDMVFIKVMPKYLKRINRR